MVSIIARQISHLDILKLSIRNYYQTSTDRLYNPEVPLTWKIGKEQTESYCIYNFLRLTNTQDHLHRCLLNDLFDLSFVRFSQAKPASLSSEQKNH